MCPHQRSPWQGMPGRPQWGHACQPPLLSRPGSSRRASASVASRPPTTSGAVCWRRSWGLGRHAASGHGRCGSAWRISLRPRGVSACAPGAPGCGGGSARSGPSLRRRCEGCRVAQTKVTHAVGCRLGSILLARSFVVFADVRFEAHYGLRSDIAPSPKSANAQVKFVICPS